MRHGIQASNDVHLHYTHTPIPTFFFSLISLSDSPPASTVIIFLSDTPNYRCHPFSHFLFCAFFFFFAFSRSPGIPTGSGFLARFLYLYCTYSLRCVDLHSYIYMFMNFLSMFSIAINLYCSLLMFFYPTFFDHRPPCTKFSISKKLPYASHLSYHHLIPVARLLFRLYSNTLIFAHHSSLLSSIII